jgi:antirestriction protein ArdC
MPSIYEIVTMKIIKQLASGVAPWRKPWTCRTAANLVTQKEYCGLNVFTLASQGFASRYWLTFNQATKLGGNIRKGEKASLVIFWNHGDERADTTQDGTNDTSRPFLLRYYSVFNFSQAEGIDLLTCQTGHPSSNPTEDRIHPSMTSSVCQRAASFTHQKNTTPPYFTNWPTARGTKNECTGQTLTTGLPSARSPTRKRNSLRK